MSKLTDTCIKFGLTAANIDAAILDVHHMGSSEDDILAVTTVCAKYILLQVLEELLSNSKGLVSGASAEALKLVVMQRENIEQVDAIIRSAMADAPAAVREIAEQHVRAAAARLDRKEHEVVAKVGAEIEKHVGGVVGKAVEALKFEVIQASDALKHATTDTSKAIDKAAASAFRRRSTWRSEVYSAAGTLALATVIVGGAIGYGVHTYDDAQTNLSSSQYWGVPLTNKDAAYYNSFVHWNPEISKVIDSNCRGNAVRRIGGRLVCDVPLWFEKPQEPNAVSLESSTTMSMAYNLEGLTAILRRQDPWLIYLLGFLTTPLIAWFVNSGLGRFLLYRRRREEEGGQ